MFSQDFDESFFVCHTFDYKNWPDDEKVLENANCDLNAALREFTELKLHVSRNSQTYRNIHPLDVWQGISQEDENNGDYLNILKIIHLTSVYPFSTACCERAFSALKRVKVTGGADFQQTLSISFLGLSCMGLLLMDSMQIQL